MGSSSLRNNGLRSTDEVSCSSAMRSRSLSLSDGEAHRRFSTMCRRFPAQESPAETSDLSFHDISMVPRMTDPVVQPGALSAMTQPELPAGDQLILRPWRRQTRRRSLTRMPIRTFRRGICGLWTRPKHLIGLLRGLLLGKLKLMPAGRLPEGQIARLLDDCAQAPFPPSGIC